ncbi:hypothetical protein F2P81_018506 [Scophthalmus maximus]|uniref:Uncharacterized protein n=1 Tax=Scophthalmus maximus TaxID=52904 RepID=A0A6A4SE43_SCOMX|nr:hypothetical protein F2P81_018506 [Scophthalmus maximus]
MFPPEARIGFNSLSRLIALALLRLGSNKAPFRCKQVEFESEVRVITADMTRCSYHNSFHWLTVGVLTHGGKMVFSQRAVQALYFIRCMSIVMLIKRAVQPGACFWNKKKALLFSDFERREKGLLWNFLRNLRGQLRHILMLSDEAGLRFCASGRISCQSFSSLADAVKNTNHASDSRVDTCVTHTTLDVAGHVSANKKSTGGVLDNDTVRVRVNTIMVLHPDLLTIDLGKFRNRTSASDRSDLLPCGSIFADPRQIVYSHTFRQRKSMSLDSTAGSVTLGWFADRYEPANGNDRVDSSARCCILPHKALFGNPSL